MISTKSAFWAVALVALGIAVLYADSKWLAVLIPAALLVWQRGAPLPRRGRN